MEVGRSAGGCIRARDDDMTIDTCVEAAHLVSFKPDLQGLRVRLRSISVARLGGELSSGGSPAWHLPAALALP